MESAATGQMLREYQARVYVGLCEGLATRPGATFTVLMPRQSGKNEIAAALVTRLVAGRAHRGGTVVVCAPTMSPQAEISVARVLGRLRRSVRPFLTVRFGTDGHSLRVGRASAIFLSALPEAHVAGHTASLALIADEAQEIDREWFDRQFRPMTASTAAPIVLLGTPWDGDTLLDRAVSRNRAQDAREAKLDLPRLHHEVSWREVAEEQQAYGLYVRGERERLGASHPLFRTQYGLETVAGAGRLLAPEDLRAIEGLHPRQHEPAPGERYAAGLDLAGEGEHADANVLTVARLAAGGRSEVIDHVAWQGRPFAEVQASVLAAVKGWRLERLCVDATGLGGPLAARLEEELGAHVVERFTFTAQSKPELGYALLAAMRTGRVSLYAADGSPEASACRQELAACRARHDGPGRLRWEAPPGGHDDYVVSLALCQRAAASIGAPRVAVGRVRASQ
jgi:hypothetical protein